MVELSVRSWVEIRMVRRSMRNGSRVAAGLYIKRVLLALEDFLFFSLYSSSCIAKQVTTLKQFRRLSCLDSLETNLEPFAPLSIKHYCYQYHLRPTLPVTGMRRKKHSKPMNHQRRMWRTDLETSDVNGYECEDDNDADTDAEEEASQADDRSTQNVVD